MSIGATVCFLLHSECAVECADWVAVGNESGKRCREQQVMTDRVASNISASGERRQQVQPQWSSHLGRTCLGWPCALRHIAASWCGSNPGLPI